MLANAQRFEIIIGVQSGPLSLPGVPFLAFTQAGMWGPKDLPRIDKTSLKALVRSPRR
jgi:hypothetical protein